MGKFYEPLELNTIEPDDNEEVDDNGEIDDNETEPNINKGEHQYYATAAYDESADEDEQEDGMQEEQYFNTKKIEPFDNYLEEDDEQDLIPEWEYSGLNPEEVNAKMTKAKQRLELKLSRAADDFDKKPAKKKRSKPYKSATMADWLVTLFLTIIPGVNVVALLCFAFLSPPTSVRRNFSRAFLIVAPFSIMMTAAIIVLSIYFFGMPLLDFFTKQAKPSLF